MLKKFVIAFICLTATSVFAQNSTVSPYSFFGIGDLRLSGTVENQMMGRLSIYADSIHVNLRNPAAYGKLKLVTYAFGGSHRELRLKSFTEQQNTSVTSMEYITIGIPIGEKMGVGIGVMPFSSTGYNLISESSNSGGAAVINEFSGEGGINRAFLSFGYNIFKNINIGATANFNFGSIENRRIQTVEDVQFGTLDERISDIRGIDFNYGLTYTPQITSKHTLFTSVTVNTQANLVSNNSQRIGSFSTSTGQEIEVIDVDLEAQGLSKTDLKLPTTATFGLGYGLDKKWFVGVEYSMQSLSDFSSQFIEIDNLSYQDASSFAFGAYFIPDYASFSNYFRRVTYRAGLRYDKTGIMVNDTEINNFGITFGIGLPLGGSFSNVNLGFELGRRGTTSADLIEESYFKVNIGLSLSDRWFQKRRIN